MATATDLHVLADVDRILVYGVTGSGKSTVAARIARRTGLPLVEVDELTWLPGWEMVHEDSICNGNRESWRSSLGADSIVRWHFKTFRRKRRRLRQWAADPHGPVVLRVTRAAQLERWLAG